MNTVKNCHSPAGMGYSLQGTRLTKLKDCPKCKHGTVDRTKDDTLKCADCGHEYPLEDQISDSALSAVAGPTIRRGKSKQDYSTPDDFMEAVRLRFGEIGFDLAASQENAKARRFFSIEEDSLKQLWRERDEGLLWLNPPFDYIDPWAEHCARESRHGAPPILFLTPASIGSNWFKKHVEPSAVVLGLNGRLCFDGIAPYPKDCILSVFWRGLTGFQTWTWKT